MAERVSLFRHVSRIEYKLETRQIGSRNFSISENRRLRPLPPNTGSKADPGPRFIASKGSVSLDGVSLTVNEVRDDTFSVLIIPHTLQVTTLGDLARGEEVNLEVDLIARYAARLLDEMRLPNA